MKNILIIGAGRSSIYLIEYLLEHSTKHNWKITVADVDLQLALSKVNNHPNGKAISFDITNAQQREAEISASDLVISMLPAFMHGDVAKDCVRLGKHMATASYVSETMNELHQEAKNKGVVLLNEIGLDPGIDHASALKIIDELKAKKCTIHTFKSFCGGLVAPEYNDNPWGYKFSWNPRYKEAYGLQEVKTMLRGTLRMPGYCKAWNAFVKLGLTDDTWKIHNSDQLTWHELIEAFLPEGNGSLEERLSKFLGEDADIEIINKLNWLGIFNKQPIKVKNASPAQILQSLLEEKWKLKTGDKDMIVMQHYFGYTDNGIEKSIISSLVVKGDSDSHTAMAKTVGLPLAITVKNLLIGKLNISGVCIPTTPEIYNPLLDELKLFGIEFEEQFN